MATEPDALMDAVRELSFRDAGVFAALLAGLDLLRPPNAAAETPEAIVNRMLDGNLRNTGRASYQGRHGSTHARAPKHFTRAALLADPVVTAPV